MTARNLVARALITAVAMTALWGCSNESKAPDGAEAGDIRYDCSINCGDDLARDRLRFVDIWCRWERDHVLVHLRVENPLVVPAKVRITPAYEIEDGGRHGTSFGSDRRISVNRSSYTEATIDAGAPEGVPTGTKISSCEPQVQTLDTVAEVDVKSEGDVTIDSKGQLGD